MGEVTVDDKIRAAWYEAMQRELGSLASNLLLERAKTTELAAHCQELEAQVAQANEASRSGTDHRIRIIEERDGLRERVRELEDAVKAMPVEPMVPRRGAWNNFYSSADGAQRDAMDRLE